MNLIIIKNKSNQKTKRILSYLLFILTILCLSGCGRVNISKEFSQLKLQAENRTKLPFSSAPEKPAFEFSEIKEKFETGLSKDEAVSIALQNNKTLQAELETLGIAKADLVQAGLFTNPNINALFRFPTREPAPGTGEMNIESVAAFKLSDLWHVPLTKQISQDLLEIVSLRILQLILDIVKHTKIAYNTCLSYNAQLKNRKKLLILVKELRTEIYYRQNYGYTSDLDKYLSDARVSELESEIQKLIANLQNAFIELKRLLGFNPTSDSLVLIDTIYNAKLEIPEVSQLEAYALTCRPEMLISNFKVKQYQDTLTLERSKVIKHVDIGVAFKQDFERPFRGWGPYFSFDLPLFDPNCAQMARVEFLLRHAEKSLKSNELMVLEELRSPYNRLKAHLKEIEYYENIVIPSYKKGIDYSYTYALTMQLTMVNALEQEIKLQEAKNQLIMLYYHALIDLAMLERALGRKLENDEL